jgi:hypothetical protein
VESVLESGHILGHKYKICLSYKGFSHFRNIRKRDQSYQDFMWYCRHTGRESARAPLKPAPQRIVARPTQGRAPTHAHRGHRNGHCRQRGGLDALPALSGDGYDRELRPGRHSHTVTIDYEGTARQAVLRLALDADSDALPFSLPAAVDTVKLRILETDRRGPLLAATFNSRRGALTSRALLRSFFGQPLVSLKVVAAIHWEALRLWLKGAAGATT